MKTSLGATAWRLKAARFRTANFAAIRLALKSAAVRFNRETSLTCPEGGTLLPRDS